MQLWREALVLTLLLLAVGAELVVLDEPTAGVDPEFRFYLWQCLTAAAKEGSAVLVSSHGIEEVTRHCGHFYMIHQKQFLRFPNGEAFKAHFQAGSLDEAFIRAASR